MESLVRDGGAIARELPICLALPDTPTVLLLQNGVGEMLTQMPGIATRVISHYFWLGDANSEFNLPYRPMINLFGTTLFALGLGLALWRFRQPADALVVLAWGLLLVPVIIFNTMLFSRLARLAFRDIRTQMARLNSFLQEAISGISIIQLFGREDYSRARFSAICSLHCLSARISEGADGEGAGYSAWTNCSAGWAKSPSGIS